MPDDVNLDNIAQRIAVVLRLGTFCFDEFHIGGDVFPGDALSSLLGAGLGSFAFASNLL